MPIYAYRCATCGHAKDVLQKMSDPVLTVCPDCGASTFEKQVTAAGFQLKGSGWYVTDFKGDNKKPAGAPADSANADASKDSSKPDGAGAEPAAGSSDGAAKAEGSTQGNGSKGDSSKGDATGASAPSKNAGPATPAASPPASPPSGSK